MSPKQRPSEMNPAEFEQWQADRKAKIEEGRKSLPTPEPYEPGDGPDMPGIVSGDRPYNPSERSA